ncbi:antibiotic biosynthesis monooxygenase [Rhodoferax sp.]|uniref:antibiotic biosynthesis monooxygenase n=1 Tax=Rhodoferax sp. TaxID=50421 RepID=UPI0025CF52D3|nr:antibiotic biosynthesis monooxygenase [Rhodoferax sp.]MCM2297635.1 antibiotic biosynthesis monooxygenase [Rhodoferax sp.]
MATAISHPVSAVTVLVSRRVKPGHASAFEQASEAMTTAARPFPGYLGGQLVRPDAQADEEESNLYHTVFVFDTPEHLQAWQASPERTARLAAIAPHTLGSTRLREVSGLGHWFTPSTGGTHQPPPRWKVAIVTWLGIFPTVYFLFLTVAPLLSDWPLLPRVMVITVLVVVLMTWVVAPRLTTWLKPFLFAPARNTT